MIRYDKTEPPETAEESLEDILERRTEDVSLSFAQSLISVMASQLLTYFFTGLCLGAVWFIFGPFPVEDEVWQKENASTITITLLAALALSIVLQVYLVRKIIQSWSGIRIYVGTAFAATIVMPFLASSMLVIPFAFIVIIMDSDSNLLPGALQVLGFIFGSYLGSRWITRRVYSQQYDRTYRDSDQLS